MGIEREIGDTSPPKESKDSLQWRKANPACSNQQYARKAQDHKPKMATHQTARKAPTTKDRASTAKRKYIDWRNVHFTVHCLSGTLSTFSCVEQVLTIDAQHCQVGKANPACSNQQDARKAQAHKPSKAQMPSERQQHDCVLNASNHAEGS